MCGVASYIGDEPALPILHKLLTRMEYRGTDSFGIITLKSDGIVEDQIYSLEPVSSYNIERCNPVCKATTGISHTRWSTNGTATLKNAHPIHNNGYFVAHNGIITNHEELRQLLKDNNIYCKSDTDTEVIAGLLYMVSKNDVLYPKNDQLNIREVCDQLEGQYAFVAISKSQPDRLFIACDEAPLYISNKGHIVSDISSLSGLADRAYKLPDKTCAVVTKFSLSLIRYDINIPNEKPQKDTTDNIMLSEIKQQTDLKIPNILFDNWVGGTLYDEVVIFGCGSSYYAGLLSQFFVEELSKTRCTVCYSSDLLYRDLSLYSDKTLFIALSQSGETADTLQVLKKLKDKDTLVITNNDMSQAVTLAKNVICLDCGTERAVASTKTYTSSVLAMLGLCTTIDLDELLGAFKDVLVNTKKIEKCANVIKDYNHVLFLARYINYPIACEAALKLKEVSNIHAEALISSEIKHGPLALIDDKVFSIFILGGEMKGGQNNVFDNLDQVKARGGKCLVITNEAMETSVRLHHEDVIVAPNVNIWCQPLVFNLVAQLLAYHCAVLKGLNPAKCRHLSKSVTV